MLTGSHLSLAVDSHMRVDMDFAHCRYELADLLERMPASGVFKDIRASMKVVWRRQMPTQCLSAGQQLEAGVR